MTQQETPQEQPEELKEYHYYVGWIEHTGLMTEEMAERFGAKPVDEPLDPPDGPRKQGERGNLVSSRDVRGEERGARARTPRNKQG